jgi:hypothetical protein
MFFTGTLQEGITLAVQESKAVVCFVPGLSSRTGVYLTYPLLTIAFADNGETSSTWQEEYFQGDEVQPRVLSETFACAC